MLRRSKGNCNATFKRRARGAQIEAVMGNSDSGLA